MSANVPVKLTPRRRPRGRAALALLPGVFALMLAGVSGVAAAANPSPSPSPSATPSAGHHKCVNGINPNTGRCCWAKPCVKPPPTAPPTSTASPTPSPSGGGSSTPTPTATPTSTPAPTSKPAPTPPPVSSSGGAGGSHSGGSNAAAGAAHSQAPVDPTPFAPLSSAVSAVTTGDGLDAARIPPVEALTPLSGLAFGNGLNLGPVLLLVDLIAIGLLVYLVRTRWLAPEA
jgi:hypothetical protein